MYMPPTQPTPYGQYNPVYGGGGGGGNEPAVYNYNQPPVYNMPQQMSTPQQSPPTARFWQANEKKLDPGWCMILAEWGIATPQV